MGGFKRLKGVGDVLEMEKIFCRMARRAVLGGSWVLLTPLISLLITYLGDLGCF